MALLHDFKLVMSVIMQCHLDLLEVLLEFCSNMWFSFMWICLISAALGLDLAPSTACSTTLMLCCMLHMQRKNREVKHNMCASASRG